MKYHVGIRIVGDLTENLGHWLIGWPLTAASTTKNIVFTVPKFVLSLNCRCFILRCKDNYSVTTVRCAQMYI